MHLTSLQSMHYRNLRTPRLEPATGITAIVGANAAGKSNILEAAYLALTGSLARGTLAEAVRLGQSEAFVGATVAYRHGSSTVKIGLKAGHKAILLDGQKIRALELAKTFAAVFISPEDISLVQGAPSQRRRFLDSLLAKLSLRYALVLREYGKVLEQRNAVLKHNPQDATLRVWDKKFIELGTEINQTRQRAVQKINELANKNYQDIAGTEKTLRVALDLSYEAESLEAALEQHRSEERARRITPIGPHRDELALQLNGHEVRRYGSRGEARTSALALRVSEYQLLEEKHGEAPVLLLDDFGAELDKERRAFLLQLAAAAPQALVTGTDAPPRYDRLWQVNNGVISSA